MRYFKKTQHPIDQVVEYVQQNYRSVIFFFDLRELVDDAYRQVFGTIAPFTACVQASNLLSARGIHVASNE